MELAEALKRCVLMSHGKVHKNCSLEINAKLYLQIDPDTEAGAKVLEWWTASDMWPIEPSTEPARVFTFEEAYWELAPKNP